MFSKSSNFRAKLNSFNYTWKEQEWCSNIMYIWAWACIKEECSLFISCTFEYNIWSKIDKLKSRKHPAAWKCSEPELSRDGERRRKSWRWGFKINFSAEQNRGCGGWVFRMDLTLCWYGRSTFKYLKVCIHCIKLKHQKRAAVKLSETFCSTVNIFVSQRYLYL